MMAAMAVTMRHTLQPRLPGMAMRRWKVGMPMRYTTHLLLKDTTPRRTLPLSTTKISISVH